MSAVFTALYGANFSAVKPSIVYSIVTADHGAIGPALVQAHDGAFEPADFETKLTAVGSADYGAIKSAYFETKLTAIITAHYGAFGSAFCAAYDRT